MNHIDYCTLQILVQPFLQLPLLSWITLRLGCVVLRHILCIFLVFYRLDSLGCCNSFQTLAWNILDEVAAILVGFLWHGNLILFLLLFHMYEFFVPIMIHFTL